ncbi:MAG: NAD(P)H-binding protein [bacterium]|nr:NAD(P)H-binding protein [bacterium]
MSGGQRHVVTGAFGYSGRYLTKRLLAAGHEVATLTGRSAADNPFGPQVAVLPWSFDRPELLEANLRGTEVLYNTYWVRFCHGATTFDTAVANTRILIAAAQAAGVRRIVHVSITNPSLDSDLPYFRGKARLEQAVIESGLSHAIVRPAVIFGVEDILINNIAWLLRRLPVFGLFGDGRYPIQPIYVEDFAELLVQAGRERRNTVIDAVGPEVFSYADLVGLIGRTVGSRARIIRVPPALGLAIGTVLGWVVGDVVVTGDEIRGLMDGLLVSHDPPTGSTALSDWLARNAETVGMRYASELRRHYAG